MLRQMLRTGPSLPMDRRIGEDGRALLDLKGPAISPRYSVMGLGRGERSALDQLGPTAPDPR
jgi:hypothetical protein